MSRLALVSPRSFVTGDTKLEVYISEFAVSDVHEICTNWDPFKAELKWRRQTQNIFNLFTRDHQKDIRHLMRREDLLLLADDTRNKVDNVDADGGDNEIGVGSDDGSEPPSASRGTCAVPQSAAHALSCSSSYCLRHWL